MKRGEGDNEAVAAARVRVEQARERLGDTVGQLSAKADLKGRTQEKTAEITTNVQQAAARTAHAVQEHTPEPVRQAAAKTAHVVQERTPEPVRQAAAKAASAGRSRPGPLLA
ncbi:hypothetical protein P8605_41965, partial [Streptomyces sp. T-3]|nr:hypothetical protein [Streptomyces sp. T-3]